MYHIIRILILILILASSVQAQHNVTNLNKKTYTFAMQSEWDSVIHYSNIAEKEGLESYEITFNAGKAYYYKSMYRKAFHYFRKAEDIVGQNAELNSFLYYSALFSGMDDMARFYRWSMTKSELKKAEINRLKILESFSTGATFSFANNIKENGNIEFFPQQAEFQNSYVLFYDDFNQYSTNLQLGLGKKFANFLSFGTLDMSSLYRKAFADTIGEPSYYNYNSSTIQKDIYTSFSYTINENLSIIPSLHYYYISTDVLRPTSDSSSANLVDTSFSELAFATSLIKESERSTNVFGISISNFSNLTQYQLNFDRTWYPKFNLNQYYTMSLATQIDGKHAGFGAGFSGGWKISSFLWLESCIKLSNMSNFTESTGLTAYNISDIAFFRFNTKAIFLIGRHLQFTLEFERQSNRLRNRISVTQGMPMYRPTAVNMKYSQNKISGGLIWTF